ncbi:hypothetical protein RB195_020390 [Necator americanus]
MEVVEEDPELKNLILHSETTQEDISSERQTPILQQIIELQNDQVGDLAVDKTQDDISVSECRTPPFSPPSKSAAQHNTMSIPKISDFAVFGQKLLKSIANAPILQRPKKQSKESIVEVKTQPSAATQTEVSPMRIPSPIPNKTVSPEKLATANDISIRQECSPKVPLAFAIMAGEVSVEIPELDEYGYPHLKAVREDDDDDSDSDDSD